ncbi:MAG: NAD(P)-dependent alcohol dehydrogenase [Myxococcota bacterium]
MRAMVYRAYGTPPEPAERPDPVPGRGQLLVRARHSSVNPIDWKLASGAYRLILPVKLPQIPGFDVAGEVVGVGPEVTGFAVGERVHARLGDTRGGATAELVVVGTDVAAHVPAGMDLAEAAALPLAGLTALQALRDHGGVALSGSTARVLIVGASGGVGHLGVQIARAAGAHVTGVCSTRNVALVESLGAHAAVDYTRPDAYAGHAPWDVVFDCVGLDYATWLPRMTPKGVYVNLLAHPKVLARAALNPFCGQRVASAMLKTNAADLRALDALYAEGKLRVVIDGRFPMERLADAWERSKSGRATGKIVVDVA